jgi:hypothetical protein
VLRTFNNHRGYPQWISVQRLRSSWVVRVGIGARDRHVGCRAVPHGARIQRADAERDAFARNAVRCWGRDQKDPVYGIDESSACRVKPQQAGERMADNGAPWADHGLEFARKDFEPFVQAGVVRVRKLGVADIVPAFYEGCGEKELPVLRGTTVPDSVKYEEAFRHGDILGSRQQTLRQQKLRQKKLRPIFEIHERNPTMSTTTDEAALTVKELTHHGKTSHEVYNAGFYENGWDFSVRSILGKASRGGADAGEVLSTIAAVGPGDRVGWFDAWVALGTRVADIAEASAAAGHRVSAARAYLRSANYLAVAVNAIDGLDGETDKVLPTFRAHRAAWEGFVAATH